MVSCHPKVQLFREMEESFKFPEGDGGSHPVRLCVVAGQNNQAIAWPVFLLASGWSLWRSARTLGKAAAVRLRSVASGLCRMHSALTKSVESLVVSQSEETHVPAQTRRGIQSVEVGGRLSTYRGITSVYTPFQAGVTKAFGG